MPSSENHSVEKDNEKHAQESESNGPLDEQQNLKADNLSVPPKEEQRKPKMITISDIELEKLQKELSEMKDKYLRVLAESENARKRLQKEKNEMIQYAIQNVIIDFLNPIDHMENALKYTQQASDEVKHWAAGFQMILSQFKDVLTNNGVTSFTSVGKPFDPHCHEAVESIATQDCPPGTVVEENLRGYLIGDKTLRPARVKVSKAAQ